MAAAFLSSNPQIVHLFERRAAHAADQRVAVATQQRIGDGFGTGGAVKLDGAVRHTAIIYRPAPVTVAAYFAAAIFSTWMVLVLASSVPLTTTLFAANGSAAFWPLST